MIIREDCGVTIIGGGMLYPGTLEMARDVAPILVAADGAASAALAAGWEPAAVIGDMDSLDMTARAALPASVLHHIAEQDSTDFDKALRNIEAPFVLGIGLLGARLDHELAVLSTLARILQDPVFSLATRISAALPPCACACASPPAPGSHYFPWPKSGDRARACAGR